MKQNKDGGVPLWAWYIPGGISVAGLIIAVIAVLIRVLQLAKLTHLCRKLKE